MLFVFLNGYSDILISNINIFSVFFFVGFNEEKVVEYRIII